MLDSLTISQAIQHGDRMTKRKKRITFEEVALEYLAEPSKKGGGKKSAKSKCFAMKLIYGYSYKEADGFNRNVREPRFLGKEVVKISDSDIAAYTKHLRRQPGSKGDFLSGGAQNNYQGAYQAIMNYAKDEKHIDYFPDWKKMQEEESDFVPTDSQVIAFAENLDELRRDLLVFAAVTGMRKSNVTLLQLNWLSDDVRYVTYPASVMKARKPVEIALNDEARKLIFKYLSLGEELKDKYKHVRDRGIKHVFVQTEGRHMGVPLLPRSITNSRFRAAREKAGISSDFKFHTVRHYFATGLFRGGVEERLVMQAGGWTDVKSVRRYAHVSNQQMRDVADKVGTIFS